MLAYLPTITAWLTRIGGAAVVLLTLQTLLHKQEPVLRNFRSPVLAVEFVETGQDLASIAKNAEWKQRIKDALPLDNRFFIPAYCLIFVLVGAMLAWQGGRLPLVIGLGVCLCVLVAGRFDYVENANTMPGLDNPSDAAAQTISQASLVKWWLFVTICGLLALALLISGGNRLVILVGALYLLAAILGAIGLAWNRPLVEWFFALMGVAIILTGDAIRALATSG